MDGSPPRYDMNPPCGTALVINVQRFKGTTEEGVTLDERRGSNIDFENLRKAWEGFGFDVKAHMDLTADEIRKVVQDTAREINENSNSFVCCITTHGDRGKIYGSDSNSLDFNEVTDKFKKDSCPYLADKPKLFFIIASGVCQNLTGRSNLAAEGSTNQKTLAICSSNSQKPTTGSSDGEKTGTVSPDAATPVTGSGDANTPATGLTPDSQAPCDPAPTTGSTNAVMPDGNVVYDHVNDSEFRSKLDPDEPHFLIAISLAPEAVGFRSENDGTWAASKLVEIFTTHHEHEDVSSMLLKVNENASKEHADKGYKQSCQLVFTTIKKVYLRSNQMKIMTPICEKDLGDETEKQEGKAPPPVRDPNWCYPMKRSCGVAVIINIKHYDGDLKFDKREGSDDDVKKLEQIWEKFGFTVRKRVDITAEEINTFLHNVASEINTDQGSSCFVCCIMTHGNMGKLYGSDSRYLDIKDVTDLFKDENCPALAGKPKLFFIQACRGSRKLRDHVNPETEKEMKGSKADFIPISLEEKDLAAADSDAVYERKNNSEFLKQANPNEINVLIGYSTMPGYVSFRDGKDGSWYINALCEIFGEYHKHEDVMSMMIRVNNEVQSQEESGDKQCPAPLITLTRKIYFN